eukprot:jgi/Picre1/31402/NNA_006754.t1
MDATRSEMLGIQELIEEDSEDSRELRDLAQEELQDLRSKYQSFRAGTGGEEACLFAKDLFSMYQRFCQFKGWTYDIVEQSQSELGGCKVAIATVSCPKYSEQPAPYALLKFESGVHRVQRVPATESGGRIHTSAASVTILPEADPLDIDIRDEDIRIDTYRSSGAGGQHVNTTNSAVRVTHIPTGTSVAIQDERSQHKNKAKALSVLRARILDAENQKAAASKSDARRQQIGSGDRSARVRTYNIPQGRVTDHRISYSIHGDLDTPFLLAGESLEEMLEKLQAQAKSLAVQDVLPFCPRIISKLLGIDTKEELCSICLQKEPRENVLQVRRSSYHDVVKVADIVRMADISHIQSYVINGSKCKMDGDSGVVLKDGQYTTSSRNGMPGTPLAHSGMRQFMQYSSGSESDYQGESMLQKRRKGLPKRSPML